jgi:putative tryptophan/tyrosine transport system substrate-binding protein
LLSTSSDWTCRTFAAPDVDPGMQRRPFVVSSIISWLLPTPIAAIAQKARAIARVGYLAPSRNPHEEALRQELRRLGYVENENLLVVHRSADGDFTRLPTLAKELVDLNVDIIVAQVTQAAIAAKSATTKIPIVMIGVSDPVASGLVASLGHPGGNVTGTSAVAAGVAGKQLELLRDLIPGIARVAVLWNPANAVFQQQQLKETKEAAAALRIELQFAEARSADELKQAFRAIAERSPPALLVLGDPVFVTHARQIADLALKYRLPSVSGARSLAEGGVLMTYGPSYHDAFQRAAVYVDRILKGARPADLPVERSARFELTVNAATARSLGISVPRDLVLRADQVID